MMKNCSQFDKRKFFLSSYSLHKQKFRWDKLNFILFIFISLFLSCVSRRETISTFFFTFHIWFKFYVKSFGNVLSVSLIHWTFPCRSFCCTYVRKSFVMGQNFNWFISPPWQFSHFFMRTGWQGDEFINYVTLERCENEIYEFYLKNFCKEKNINCDLICIKFL